jgi:hypothetical protein
MFLGADENIRNKSVEKGCLSFIEYVGERFIVPRTNRFTCAKQINL